jgi:hypothetical protein
MLDLNAVEQQDFSLTLKRLNALKGKLPKAIADFIKESEILSYVIQFDPSPKLSYTKWLMTRLYRNPANIAGEIQISNAGSNRVRTLLAEFDGIKHKLDVKDRDIFNYRTIEQLEAVLIEQRKGRFKASKKYLKHLDIHETLLDTLVHTCDGLSVHRPRSIEDVIVLTGGDQAFDLRGDAAYRMLSRIGEIYVFNTDYGPLVGALPAKGQKGYVVDCTGEAAMFEDALNLHQDVDWERAPEILSLMIKIDPALPFDLDLETVEPYQVALTQFPLILHEDRAIPDEFLHELMADPEIGKAISETLEVR